MRLGTVYLHGPSGQPIECHATGELGLQVFEDVRGRHTVCDPNFSNGKNDFGVTLAIAPNDWAVVYGWEIDGVNVPAGTDSAAEAEDD